MHICIQICIYDRIWNVHKYTQICIYDHTLNLHHVHTYTHTNLHILSYIKCAYMLQIFMYMIIYKIWIYVNKFAYMLTLTRIHRKHTERDSLSFVYIFAYAYTCTNIFTYAYTCTNKHAYIQTLLKHLSILSLFFSLILYRQYRHNNR